MKTKTVTFSESEIEKHIAAVPADKTPGIVIKKQYVEKRKIERAYDQESFLEEELSTVASVTAQDHDDVFTAFGNDILGTYVQILKQEQTSLKNAVPFINEVFDEKFRLVPGQLVTVAAYTGRGKSTTMVNVAARYISAGKRAFIISNEELAKDMYDMVACLLENVNHGHLVNQTLPQSTCRRIFARVKQLIDDKLLFVIDGELSGNGTTKAEYILAMIKAWDGATVKPDVVLIDYLTNIYSAGSTTADNHYYQLERFLTELKNLLNTVSFPIVMAAQMHSDDKKKGNSLDQKLIMGGAIQRYSTIVLEVRTDADVGTSDYVIHKNRRFKKKGSITLMYDKGLMRPLGPNEQPLADALEEVAKDPEV